MPQVFRKWHFANQVLFVMSLLQLIIFFIFFYLAKFHFNYLEQLMKKIQVELLQSINASQNKIIVEIYADSCNYGILRSELKLMAADRLNHFIQFYDISIPNTEICLIPPFVCSIYALNYTFTYAFMNRSINQTPQNDLDRQAIKLSAMLTYTSLFADEDIIVFFTTSSDSLYWTTMPGTYYVDFNPHQRVWSLNNTQAMIDHPNNTYFSDPYMSILFGTYFIAQTKALTNLQYQSQGILSTGINFDLFKFYQGNNREIQIIDQFGKLLLQKNDILKPKYIYNTSITGYSYEDFLNVKNFYYNPSNYTCQIEDISFAKTICLYNQVTKKTLTVTQKVLKKSHFIITITQDLSETASQIRNNFLIFNQQIYGIQSSYFIITFLVTMATNALGFILIHSVLRRIHKLKHFLQYYLRGGFFSNLRRKKEIMKKTTIIHKSSNSLEKLEYRIINLYDQTHLIGKSQECLELEEHSEYLIQDPNDMSTAKLEDIDRIFQILADSQFNNTQFMEIISQIYGSPILMCQIFRYKLIER